ncbi:MAG TPA: hypothetical protein VGE67_15110, partial [Haloferula sp.]
MMKTGPLFHPANPSPPQADALNAMMGKVITDLGAAANGALVILGDRLGLYRALAEAGLSTSADLATRTGLHERYVREWLATQAASGYVNYDAASEAFSMTSEQSAVFADPDSPVAMAGGFYSVSALYHDEPLVTD